MEWGGGIWFANRVIMASLIAAIAMVAGGEPAEASLAAAPTRLTVMAFLGVECPMARLAAHRLN